jgi:hypothetical protein
MRNRTRALLLALLAITAIAGAVLALDRDAFTSPRLVGTPLVLGEDSRAHVLFVTTHMEEVSLLNLVLEGTPRQRVHVDLWSVSAADLSTQWVRRVVTVPYHARHLDPALLGADADTVWLTAASTTHRLALADGARREATSAPAATTLRRPMAARHIYQGDRYARARAAVLDGGWYGLARPEELSGLARDPFSIPDGAGRYRLHTARVVTKWDNFFRRDITEYRDFAPAPQSRELLNAGLLIHLPDGRPRPISAADPVRLFALHEVREEGLLTRGLACLRLDGAECWNKRLGATAVLGAAPLLGGPASQQALLLLAIRARPGESEHEVPQALMRVNLADGALIVLTIAAIDTAGLKSALAR